MNMIPAVPKASAETFLVATLVSVSQNLKDRLEALIASISADAGTEAPKHPVFAYSRGVNVCPRGGRDIVDGVEEVYNGEQARLS